MVKLIFILKYFKGENNNANAENLITRKDSIQNVLPTISEETTSAGLWPIAEPEKTKINQQNQ
jgi:hypothetical protein